MDLKYWETMSEREKAGTKTAGPVFAGALRSFDKAAIGLKAAEISWKDIYDKKDIDEDDDSSSEADNIQNEQDETEKQSNLPRPLALIFGTLLILISTVGISILTAIVFVMALALAAVAAALLGGGILAIFEAFANISSAPVVSVECMGIGFAAIALGIIVFVIAAKFGFELLPKTTSTYQKAIKTAVNL